MADLLAASSDPRALDKAIEISPHNWRYLLRRASRAGDDAKGDLQRVLQLNPYSSKALIALGLQAELEGDPARAESYFLKAAKVDRTTLPRWSLANFYYRQGRGAEFFHWSRQTLQRDGVDAAAIYDLCFQRTRSVPELLEGVVPGGAIHRERFLAYLLSHGMGGDCAPAARRLLEEAARPQAPTLVLACEGLLNAKRWEEAVEIWNGMAEKGLHPYASLRAEETNWVTNPLLSREPLRQGFDWRYPKAPGLVVRWTAQGVWVEVSGRQPEHVVLIEQFLPVLRPGTLRLRCVYRARWSNDAAPPYWLISAHGDPERAGIASPPLGGNGSRDLVWDFRPPSGTRMLRLTLLCVRQPGAMRLEGTIFISRVELGPSPSA